MKIRLNRSLNISFDEKSNIIKAGHTFLDFFEIEAPPKFLVPLLKDLNSAKSIQQITEKYESQASAASYDIATLINILQEENILTKEWHPDRYDRHRLFFDLSRIDQAAAMTSLLGATVGIMGAGGIGSNVATLLAAAGIGKLKVSDGDIIEESNLTRTTVFREFQIGKLKVDSLKENIHQQNNHCTVETLPLLLSNENLDVFKSFFENCDIIVLSADPENSFEFVNKIHKGRDIPIINAGYLGRMGLIGPMMNSQSSPNFQDLYAKNVQENQNSARINNSYQAPSYGPLNYIVSAACSHEVIKYIATGKNSIECKRLLINPDTYETYWHDYKKLVSEPDNNCEAIPATSSKDTFDAISDYYNSHRETSSLNNELLDGYIKERLTTRRYSRILDVGCGIGTYCRMLTAFSDEIIGLDTNENMLSYAKSRGGRIDYHLQDLLELNEIEKYELIILSLVLDHIENFEQYINKASQMLDRKKGKILCIIPNPVKDSCTAYEHGSTRLSNYYYEGLQKKNRQDENGNNLFEVISFKRTLATYLNAFSKAGLCLHHIEEPRHPDINHLGHHVPYFTVLEYHHEY